jgi:hypothetical protein
LKRRFGIGKGNCSIVATLAAAGEEIDQRADQFQPGERFVAVLGPFVFNTLEDGHNGSQKAVKYGTEDHPIKIGSFD